MKAKKTAEKKSSAAKTRDLPERAVNAKTGQGVRGGGKPYANEKIALDYGTIEWKYTPQKPDGSG